MAISTTIYLAELNEFLNKIEQYPEYAEEEKINFLAKISRSEYFKRISILTTVLSKIYDSQYKMLKRDLSKVLVLDEEKIADEQERIDFLRCIKGTIDFYTMGDYSDLFNYIDSMCLEDDYDYEDLPFN